MTNLRRIAVLMTCFNRKEMTLACLNALTAAAADSCSCTVFLVDDGSSDGTSESVARAHPSAQIVHGSGDLYWNGGMRLAWQAAIPQNPDFYLWLNDDTVLRPRAIADLLATYDEAAIAKTIVVGRTVGRRGNFTYGGYRRSGRASRLSFRPLADTERECETMNGNCVLIPARAVIDIGINSKNYRHAYGDVDYGLRAIRAGYSIIEMKPPVATQEFNDSSLSRLGIRNWRFALFHPKGISLSEWFCFCREHGGPFWIGNFVWRYVKMLSPRRINLALESQTRLPPAA